MTEELELLARARALDAEALAIIHRTYYKPIFRYIVTKVNDKETADDLTSDVFVRLLNALQDKSAPSNTLRGWLFSVASRVVNDYYRKQYRDEKYAPAMVQTDEVEPAGKHTDLSIDLLQAVQQLTPEQQDVVALRFGSGLKLNDIAILLGKEVGAVKQLQVRALRSLSRLMGGGRHE